MLYQTTEPSEDRSITYHMPPNGYMVRLPMVHVHVTQGIISIGCFGPASIFKRYGRFRKKYLEEVLAPCLRAYEDLRAHEEMFQFPEQEKV